MFLVLLLTFLLLKLRENNIFDIEAREIAKLIHEGRNQHNLIEKRSYLPQCDLCWKSSVVFLHDGCKHLMENAQTEIAQKFTDCFLKTAGHDAHECEKHPARYAHAHVSFFRAKFGMKRVKHH
jgi:hypothetical protein